MAVKTIRRIDASASSAEPSAMCTRRLRVAWHAVRQSRALYCWIAFTSRGMGLAFLRVERTGAGREGVARATNRPDIVELARVALDLLAERCHTDVHRPAVTKVLVAPDLAKERLAAEDVLRRAGQRYQQV